MNLNAITADILHIADTAAQTKPAITVQSVPVCIVKLNLGTNNVSETSSKVDVKSHLL
jgi:hypothetical protein